MSDRLRGYGHGDQHNDQSEHIAEELSNCKGCDRNYKWSEGSTCKKCGQTENRRIDMVDLHEHDELRMENNNSLLKETNAEWLDSMKRKKK